MKALFNIDFLKAFLAALLFGAATPLSKILLDTSITPILLAALYYLGAALFLLPFSYKNLRYEYKYIKNNNRDLFRLLGAVIFGGVLGPVFLLYGIKNINAHSASLLLNFETVFTSILAWTFFKEHLGKRIILSSLLTLIAGSLLVIGVDFSINLGGILIFLACICWGLDNNFTATIEGISPTTNTVIKGFVAGTFNLIIAAIWFDIVFEPLTILYGLIIGFLSYGLSIVLYISSARKIGAVRSQIIFAINPFFGSLLSFVLIADILELKFIIAFIVMIVAVLLIFSENHEHVHVHEEVEHTHEHHHDDDHHNHSHNDLSNFGNHTHMHKHKSTRHCHLHYPDTHHRHNH